MVFAEVLDFELGELAGRVFDKIAEDRLFVVADEDDFFDRGNFGDGLEAMPEDWVAGDVEEWLVFGLAIDGLSGE